MTHIKPIATPAWQALTIHYDKIKTLHLREMFAKDPGRGERFVAEGAGLYLDYSKNRTTKETVRLLLSLAEERGVAAWCKGINSPF
jgi:glucose-6-phosphate isomerase